MRISGEDLIAEGQKIANRYTFFPVAKST